MRKFRFEERIIKQGLKRLSQESVSYSYYNNAFNSVQMDEKGYYIVDNGNGSERLIEICGLIENETN